METKRLRHAVVLGNVLSFTKAAAQLNITQSALSRSIQVLEEEFQVRLFDRSRSSAVHVTSVGRSFLRDAERLLQDKEHLERRLHQAARGVGGEIALGFSPLPARAMVPALLAELIANNIDAQVAIAGPTELLDMLTAGKIELCVCSAHRIPRAAPVQGIPLAQFSFSLVVRSGHPLASEGEVTLEQIDEYPLITTGQTVQNSDVAAAFPSLMHKRPSAIVESYDILMRTAAVTDAIWLSSPQVIADELAAGQFQILTIGGKAEIHTFDMMVYWLDRRSLSPIAARALDYMKGCAGKISQ